jgi:hypothetical protein
LVLVLVFNLWEKRGEIKPLRRARGGEERERKRESRGHRQRTKPLTLWSARRREKVEMALDGLG